MPLVCATGTCDPDECVELTTRELSVCDVVCRSREPVSFTQLKESTNLHQEILSRILHRLDVHGLVQKVGGKYAGDCGRPISDP
jgi:DNA-binding IscR family transcriptional regulator